MVFVLQSDSAPLPSISNSPSNHHHSIEILTSSQLTTTTSSTSNSSSPTSSSHTHHSTSPQLQTKSHHHLIQPNWSTSLSHQPSNNLIDGSSIQLNHSPSSSSQPSTTSPPLIPSSIESQTHSTPIHHQSTPEQHWQSIYQPNLTPISSMTLSEPNEPPSSSNAYEYASNKPSSSISYSKTSPPVHYVPIPDPEDRVSSETSSQSNHSSPHKPPSNSRPFYSAQPLSALSKSGERFDSHFLLLSHPTMTSFCQTLTHLIMIVGIL